MTITRSLGTAFAVLVALVVGMSAFGLLRRQAAAQNPSTGDAAQGKALYEKKCAVCHGAEGMGDGKAEFVLFPKPRNFTKGIFKIRATTTLPTDTDLFRTITRGISGTAMPTWGTLTETERWNLVAFIKSLSPRFTDEQPGPPVAIPKPPPSSPTLLALGKHYYTEAGCFDCHGTSGRGDGPAAETLKDEWGYPIVPYDFTIHGRMKAGSTLQDLYRTLTAGIGGTPMPSYADSLDEQQRWGLSYYVLSLANEPAPGPAAQEVTTIRSGFVAGTLPTDPSAALWQQAKPIAIRTRTLWLRAKETESIRVASFHNGKQIGVLLEWDDPIMNHETLRHQDFRDAAAVQFPNQETEPTHVMGEHTGPVNIWHWKADWEADLAHYRDVQDRYPGMGNDFYPFLVSSPVLLGAPEGDLKEVQMRTSAHNPTYLTGWGAGNLFSLPARLTPVENLNATGLGTITSQPAEYQTVKGHGIWADGKWRVVMVRALRTDNDRDTQLTAGSTVPVAFAIWDGAQGDRDGRKAVTVWQRLVLQPKP